MEDFNQSLVEIDNKLFKEIEEYCKLNDITDIQGEVNKILRKGFNIQRYGATPFERRNMEQSKPPIKEEPKVEQQVEIQNTQPTETEVVKEKPKEEASTATEEPKPKRKYTRKVRIIKNE